jgi:hypothetical protein
MRPASQIRRKTGLMFLLAVPTMLLLLAGPRFALPEYAGRIVLNHGTTPFSLSISSSSGEASSSGLYRAAPQIALAIADFTGDTHPDSATVQLHRVDSSNAQYSIEIRLTEGGDQILALAAPFGGLLVTPKDVTADGNLDLVIRSATNHALVAVLLNDGSGHFHRSDNELFPAERNDDSSSCRVGKHAMFIAVALGCPESHPSIASPPSSPRPVLDEKPLLLPADFRSMSRQLPCITSNRAPPSLV